MAFTDMDINVIRKYLEASPDILIDIKNIQNYRNLRTEQAYYSKLSYEYDHGDFLKRCKEVRDAGELTRSYWRDRISSLDKKRRDTHNKALSSFEHIIKVGEQHKLDYIYVGPRLTSQQAYKYEDSYKRAEITDAMFELLYSIENSVETSLGENQGLSEVHSTMKSFNKSYKVNKSLTKDESDEKDGGIEFNFSLLDDLLNNQENL